MPRLSKTVQRVDQAVSIRYNNLVYELQAAGRDLIVLSLGEAFFDLPLHSFDDLPRPEVFHYSHSRGLLSLREKLAAYYDRHYGVPTDPQTELLITAGSKAAIHMTLMSLLDPGDEVVVLEPAWVSYVEQIRLCHGVPVNVPWDKGVAEIDAYVTPRTKAIIVNAPNNPRGQAFSDADWRHLHQIADQRDVFLLCDEAYSDFLPADERFVSGGLGDPEKRHTIICNSMSKNFGMSGWRIGYVIATPAVIDEVLKVDQHLITCPPTILTYYLDRHFDDLLAVTEPQIAAVVERRREVMRELDRRAINYLPGTATFYLFVSIDPSSLGSEEFCTRLLHEHDVAVVPGIGYGESCDRFVRVSTGTEPMDRMGRAFDAIRALIDETAGEPSSTAGPSGRSM